MASGIMVGILGSLRFDPDVHLWALEVGQYLGAYEILTSNRDDRSPRFVEQRGEVMDEINSRLASHNILYRVPDIRTSPARDCKNAADQVLQYVRGFASQGHCAFVLIGNGCFLLGEGCKFIAGDQRDEIRRIALGRFQYIRTRYPTLGLMSDELYQALSQKGSHDLTTGSLMQWFLEIQEPMVVLIISADPRDQDRLRLAEERRELAEALNLTRFRDAFQIHDVPSCRVRDITTALDRHNPSILHFSGHGSRKGLCFQNDAGKTNLVRQEDLAVLFGQQRNLKAVILNACYSRSQAQVIADKVGYVIAMEDAIEDRDAITFSREFYTALGFGRSFEAAFSRAEAGARLEARDRLQARLLLRRSPEEIAQAILEPEESSSLGPSRLFEKGRTPSTMWLVVGAVLGLLAAILLARSWMKSNIGAKVNS